MNKHKKEIAEEETITIPKSEYDEMKKAYDFLIFIQQYGLENWEGYDLALNLYELLTKMGENNEKI